LELAGKQPSLELRLAMRLRSVEQHERAFLAIDIFDPSGSWVMQGIPEIQPFLECDRRSRELRATVDLPGLIPGHYSAGVWIGSHFSRTLVEVREAVGFEVVNSPTPGRTKAHSPARGYVVPRSHVTHLGRSE
jgi:hypothetical protein